MTEFNIWLEIDNGKTPQRVFRREAKGNGWEHASYAEWLSKAEWRKTFPDAGTGVRWYTYGMAKGKARISDLPPIHAQPLV